MDVEEREEEEEEGRWACAGPLSPSVGVYTHGSLHPGALGPKAEAQVPDGGLLLSPRVQKALEGVHYIADHLRAEDADSSVSGGWGRVPPLGDSTSLEWNHSPSPECVGLHQPSLLHKDHLP